ncbi:DNA topoisomerase-3 [Phyllobacterium myrsinacearum]|uniref:DNA topoisomerase n=1 Tax=Phyllobacterium myrsinacearum TaxID=28101 RepID=UPI001029F960|nr:DNA topoisomerase [Phyllobacterium myrsinacearum]RZS76878.1 DNA topoisomerase-3 [Phyllobacterium myrsinacearum]
MSSVIICEKPSQARRIHAVIGTQYGRILAAQGHLLRLQAPGEVKPEWKAWSDDILVPPSGLYAYVPDEGDGKQRRLEEIGTALKDATRVIIATDTDREGQLIGESIVRYFGFGGEVLRAWWKSEDETAFRQAFANLKRNGEYIPLYDSGVARAQGDQIFNLTLTRVATKRLRPQGWTGAIGIGRVKTPTLGIICKRELEIRNFVPRAYCDVSARFSTNAEEVTLWFRPRGDNRLFDKARAQLIRSAAETYTGPIRVTSEHKRTAPPRPLDMTALQKHAGAWGWSASKVLEVTQSLYETHTLVTYPRADTRYLPENMAGEAEPLLAALARIEAYSHLVPATPTVRTGKSGTYCNAGLNGAPHHAIIPNINVADEFAERYGQLGDEERKIFDAIAKAWLAAVAPDHEYDETVMDIVVGLDDASVPFTVRGRVVTHAGWKSIVGEETADEQAEDDADDSAVLPPIPDGAEGRVSEAKCHGKITEAPKRYTDGELPTVMQNAWKFVDDAGERDRLKETHGIGTTATRAAIIEGLKHQNFITVDKGRLVPTELGLWLYNIVVTNAADLTDVGMTARLEDRLSSIYRGEATAADVIRDIVRITTELVQKLSASASSGAAPEIDRLPTPGMLAAVRAKAKREGIRLTAEMLKSFNACRAYLGPMRDSNGTPSEKQLAYAQRLAVAENLALPDAVRGEVRKLSGWIDTARKQHGLAAASDKQMEWIRKFVGDGVKPPLGYPDTVSLADAKAFLDKVFVKGSGREQSRRADRGRRRGRSQRDSDL